MGSNEIHRKIREYLESIVYKNLRIFKKWVNPFLFFYLFYSLIYGMPTSVSLLTSLVASLHLFSP